jgi:hypothetical protein
VLRECARNDGRKRWKIAAVEDKDTARSGIFSSAAASPLLSHSVVTMPTCVACKVRGLQRAVKEAWTFLRSSDDFLGRGNGTPHAARRTMRAVDTGRWESQTVICTGMA